MIRLNWNHKTLDDESIAMSVETDAANFVQQLSTAETTELLDAIGFDVVCEHHQLVPASELHDAERRLTTAQQTIVSLEETIEQLRAEIAELPSREQE